MVINSVHRSGWWLVRGLGSRIKAQDVILKNREKNSMVQEKASLHTLRLGGSSESSYKQ